MEKKIKFKRQYNYDINLSNKGYPIENRKCNEFPIYYEKMWRDLDVSI